MRLGIGLGGVLLVLGLFWAVEFDMPGATDDVLSMVVMLVGGLAIVLTLVNAAVCPPRGNVSVTGAEGLAE